MIAAVVTMFFLYTYGMINLAAVVESFAQNPSFRPRFRFYHWSSAGLGALACVGTALLIDALAAFAAVVIASLIYAALRRKTLKVRFGDARWGFFYSRARAYLLKLSTMPSHPKNWRRIVLVLSGRPEDRLAMSPLALWIGHERGWVTLARVLVGELDELARHREAAIDQVEAIMRSRFSAVPSEEIEQLGQHLHDPFPKRFRAILYVAKTSATEYKGSRTCCMSRRSGLANPPEKSCRKMGCD